MGPVGAVVLAVAGIGGLVWLFLGPSGAAAGPATGYGVGKVVCIGLVLGGATALERFRGRRSRVRGTEEQADG
jgi:hypothetical protein